LLPGRRLDVEDCTVDDLIALHTVLGISRALLVQSFQHGHSYEYMLHALTLAPERFRGVAAPASDVTDGELELLERTGVIGARFAYMASPAIDARLLARIAERGWQAHFMVEGADQIAAWRETILGFPNSFVIEHLGMPPAGGGVESPEFGFVLDALATGRCWVKLSPRFSREPVLPFADVLPFIRAVVGCAPERLLWGSDWPHPNYFEPMPNDADLVDLLSTWIPDAATLRRVLVDNPAELFGF
jgi:predicted TIM-barrel fold metal-dependent hydrolase